MAGITSLLGDTLLAGQESISTSEALNGKTVALYFSAHWCPPCRGFTPKFAEWYTKDLKAKGLEVIFCSSDRDEAAFAEYYGEMPWLALPFSDRDRKESLSKRFKVQGIPTVVILDSDGNLLNKDGRSAVSSDPTGEDLPWRTKTLPEILDGMQVQCKDGSAQSFAAATKGKTVAFYFSAHWCPPCRGFTPQMAEWYTKDLNAKGLEVVFCSSDRDEASFNEYFTEMPWLALSYTDRKRKEMLSDHFGVSGIPSIAIVDPDGTVITKDGRAAISSDPTGEEFPWHPKPVFNLKGGPGNINEVPTVIALCETQDPETQKAIEEAMNPISIRFKDEAKAAGEEDPKIAFAIATESGGIPARLREIFKLPAIEGTSASLPAKLCLCDIPDNGGYYVGADGDITASAVEQFVDGYLAKTLERNQLG